MHLCRCNQTMLFEGFLNNGDGCFQVGKGLGRKFRGLKSIFNIQECQTHWIILQVIPQMGNNKRGKGCYGVLPSCEKTSKALG